MPRWRRCSASCMIWTWCWSPRSRRGGAGQATRAWSRRCRACLSFCARRRRTSCEAGNPDVCRSPALCHVCALCVAVAFYLCILGTEVRVKSQTKPKKFKFLSRGERRAASERRSHDDEHDARARVARDGARDLPCRAAFAVATLRQILRCRAHHALVRVSGLVRRRRR